MTEQQVSAASNKVDPDESFVGTIQRPNSGSQEVLHQGDSWPHLTVARPAW